ncbi:MAG: class I SAM-dependent methyltransferase [Acidimicrobiales bacterium]|nr:class I SAM-dependent methyltransferase [Acidimicrobiales bacterium]RZV47431.1 MAG: class I SAM-dependent methyltransferase [Acidimicrobiales bacterium]
MDLSPEFEDNRNNWNDRALLHSESQLYNFEHYRTSDHVSATILYDLPLMGDVTGKRIAHLQCHIGTDTISLDRVGAGEVVGLDFAPDAIRIARKLATDCNSSATFVEANVYDAREVLQGDFDIVYTSVGTICWLDDLDRWAAAVASLLKPGGLFYIRDGHPALWPFEESDGVIAPMYNYFTTSDEPLDWDTNETYTDGDHNRITHTRHHEWNHPLPEIFNAVSGSGLRVDRMEEHKEIEWPFFPSCPKVGDQWILPEPWGSAIPAMFSIWASKQSDQLERSK